MTLALPKLSQMRQLPAFPPSPFQWWRQRIKRPQQISVQREIRLAYFKSSCGLHHESPHSTMFYRPLKRALIAKFIPNPALKRLGCFHSSANADNGPPATAGGTDKTRTITPSLTVGLLPRSRCALNADGTSALPASTRSLPLAVLTSLAGKDAPRSQQYSPHKIYPAFDI